MISPISARYSLVDGEVELMEVVRPADAALPSSGHVMGLEVLDEVRGPLDLGPILSKLFCPKPPSL